MTTMPSYAGYIINVHYLLEFYSKNFAHKTYTLFLYKNKLYKSLYNHPKFKNRSY